MEVTEFRYLYHFIETYKGEYLYQDVLIPWIPKATQILSMLQVYGQLDAMKWYQKEKEKDLWGLYALSRISDLLLLSFQVPNGDQVIGEIRRITGLELRRPMIQLADYEHFFSKNSKVFLMSFSSRDGLRRTLSAILTGCFCCAFPAQCSNGVTPAIA